VNNFLYDCSQVGIPFDNVDPEYLLTPRKWEIANIRRFMMYVGPISSIFDYATFFLMLYFYRCIMVRVADDPATMPYQTLFQTAWFVESILTQTMIVHIIRTRRIPFIQSCASPVLLFTTVTIMAVGAWLPYSPMAGWLGMVPLPPSFWGFMVLFILLYSTLTHFVKTWYFNKFGID